MAFPSPLIGVARSHSKELSDPTFPSVEEYVKTLGGTKVIDTVLIANNGIAAVKVRIFACFY